MLWIHVSVAVANLLKSITPGFAEVYHFTPVENWACNLPK